MSFIQTHLEKIDQYLNDHPKVKFLLPQVILIIFVLSIIFYFSFNASSNLSARGINTGFGFLSNKASFDIQFSLIEFNSSMTYGRAYLVCYWNFIRNHSRFYIWNFKAFIKSFGIRISNDLYRIF